MRSERGRILSEYLCAKYIKQSVCYNNPTKCSLLQMKKMWYKDVKRVFLISSPKHGTDLIPIIAKHYPIMISSMVFKAAGSVFICHSPWTLDFLLGQSLPRPCLSNYQPRTAFSSSFCRAISQVAAQGSNKGQSWLSGGCLTWQGSLNSSAFTSSLGAQIDELEPLLPHQVLLATFQTSHTRHTLQGKQPNPMDLSSFALREF